MATTTDRDTISDRDTIYFLSQELAKAHLRIAQLEADLGAEPNPPEPTPPVPFTGDWVEMGHTAIDASDIAAKASNKSEWEWAVGDQRTNPSVPELWAHLLDYAQKALNQKTGKPIADTTRETKMACIKGVASRLRLPTDEAYEMMFAKLQTKNDYETSYKQLGEEELEAYKCADGGYITTQRLRDFCEEQLGKVESDEEAYNLMCLSFFAFHGNRKQDWGIGYKQVSPDGRGYYCPDTSEVHLHQGKTQKTGTVRTFKVHPIVAQLIARVHENKASTWLVPQLKDPTKCNTAIDKLINRKFFFGKDKVGWGEGKPNPFGFPCKITTTTLRDLFETHIRYGDHKLPQEEIEALMKIIGHSDKTALKKYAQLFRGMTGELS